MSVDTGDQRKEKREDDAVKVAGVVSAALGLLTTPTSSEQPAKQTYLLPLSL